MLLMVVPTLPLCPFRYALKITFFSEKSYLFYIRSINKKAFYMVKNCDYCEKEFSTNRDNQRFCCENCKIFRSRWDKREPKTPFKPSFSRNVTDLYKIALDVQKLYDSGNCVSESAIKAIELGHFSVIPSHEKKYLTNIWNKFYEKR